MSIMVGITTNKVLLIAAALFLPVRVDREKVEAVIDDTVPISVISTKLAQRLHIAGPHTGNAPIALRRPIHISIGGEEFPVAIVRVSDEPFADEARHGRDVILGDDLLRTSVLDLDFAHGRIRLILPGERDHFIRGFDAVAVTSDANGHEEIAVRIGDGGPMPARLDLGSAVAVAVKEADGEDESDNITLGTMTIPHVPIVRKESWTDVQRARVGLALFAKSHIVLDLPHRTIWIARQTHAGL